MLPLLGLLIYFFFQFIRPQDWIWLSLMNAPLDYLIFSFIIITGAGKFTQCLSRLTKEAPFRLMCCYFFLVCFSNIVNGEMESLSLYSVIVFKLILIYVMIAAFVDTFAKRVVFVGFLTLLVVIIAYQSLYQVENGVGWAGQSLNWRGSIQWIGDFDGTNSLCVLFLFVLPFLISLTLGPWGKIGKLFGAVGGGLVIYSIYLTESRGGMIALLVIIAAYSWNKIKRKSLVFAIVGAIVLVVVAVGPSRISSGDTSDSSARYRIKMWEKGLEVVRYHSPLFGIGYGNFPRYSYRLEPHNNFVLYMSELGLVGLFTWVGMFFFFFKIMLALRRDQTLSLREQSLLNGVMISLIGWMSVAFFLTLRKSFFPFIIFGLISGYRLDNKQIVSWESGDVKKIALIEVIGILVIWIVVSIYFALN